MSFSGELEWPRELEVAIRQHATALGAASKRVVESGVSDFPVIIAYLDGVDWCPVVLPGSPATNGWHFAITNLEEMVRLGAVSERAGEMMKIGGGSKDDFRVFNVEIPKINLRRFDIP